MILGKGHAWFETGTEGVMWSVYENGKQGYDGLNVIKTGDKLTIYDKGERGRETVLWEGVVELEFERRYRSYPMNPANGQQEVFGMWVHGFEKTLDPEVWAKYFFDEHEMTLVPKGLTTTA